MKRPAVIIGIAAVLVLTAGIVVLSLWPEPTPEPAPAQSPAPEVPTVDLFIESYFDILNIEFTPDTGIPYVLHFDQELDTIILDSEHVIFPGDEDLLFAVFFNAAGLSRLTHVTTEADDSQLELFGFDQPAMNIRFNLFDGTVVEVEIGDVQAAGQGRYARLVNSREIALLTDIRSLILTLNIELLYEISFFPVYLFNDLDAAVFSIDHILLETGTGVTEIRRRTIEELTDFTLGFSTYQVLQPSVIEGNDGVIQTMIMENIVLLMPNSVVQSHPEDLSLYGLDAPSRLTITAGEWSGSLLIGNRDGESGGRFVMIEGHDAVLLDINGDYSFLDIPFTQLRSTLIWIHNIIDVSTVTYELEGVTRVLQFEHDSGDSDLRGWLDDVELSESNARRLYVAAMMIYPNGETDAPIPSEDPPAYTIIITKLDGSSEKLELYQLNDSQFLIVHNGENKNAFMTRMALQQNLLKKFEILDSGGDIPMM